MAEHGGSGFLTGFFIGAALGAMTALLLAPKSGKELREEMSAEGKRLRDRAEGFVAEARGRAEGAYLKSRDTLKGTAEGLREAAHVLSGD
jgi:gas vesicle protein